MQFTGGVLPSGNTGGSRPTLDGSRQGGSAACYESKAPAPTGRAGTEELHGLIRTKIAQFRFHVPFSDRPTLRRTTRAFIRPRRASARPFSGICVLNRLLLTLRRAREERLPQVAGSLTFTTVLSLVPLLAVSFALFTRFAAWRGVGQALQRHLLEGLLPADISRTVLKHLGQFTANAGGLTPLGFLFVFATALATVFTVENVLNRIWQVRKDRPLLRRLGLYLVMLAVAPALLGASLWATSYLQAASAGLLRSVPPWAAFVLNLGPVLLGAAGFAALFRFVPNAPVRWREAIAGGLLAAIAFELGKRGFALYLQKVPTYRTVYGAFAPLLVFLLWVYFSWLVTLAAALVTASLSRPPRQSPRRLSRA